MTTAGVIEPEPGHRIAGEGASVEESVTWTEALKQGLSRAGVAPAEELACVAERPDEWRRYYRPANSYDEWVIEQAATLSVRIERSRVHDWALRMLAVERAENSWDADRRLAAEELGARLAKQPAVIAWRLRRTRQGCDWLLLRWTGLAAALSDGRDWTDAQHALALDMLGTPAELRDGPTRLDPRGAEGADLRAARLAVAEREVATLEVLRDEALEGLDQSERTAAMMGFFPEIDKNLLHVMRYESNTSRQMHWALKQLFNMKRAEPAAEPSAAAPARATAPRHAPVAPQPGPPEPRPTAAAVAAEPPPPAPPAAPPDEPEPAASRSASAPVEPPPAAAAPAPSIRFDASAEPMAIPASSGSHSKGMADLFATSSAPAGNRRARRAKLSRERRG